MAVHCLYMCVCVCSGSALLDYYVDLTKIGPWNSIEGGGPLKLGTYRNSDTRYSDTRYP